MRPRLLSLIDDHAKDKGPPVILKWKGSHVPTGQSARGHKIRWTQHGVVQDYDGDRIGSYVRMTTNGGPDKDEHEMWITMWVEGTDDWKAIQP